MTRLYDWTMRHLGCCGCGCFIPIAATLATAGASGYWMVTS